MSRLPPTTQDPVILSRDLYNQIADELTRLANLDVSPPLEMTDNSSGRTISLRPQISRMKWGNVVCNGPAGQDDFTDNRYWVQHARFGATSPVTLVPIASAHLGYEIVEVTNLFEDNGHSHYVRPGTPVAYWGDYDNGTPPVLRHVMLVADEGTSRSGPCDGTSTVCPADCSAMSASYTMTPSIVSAEIAGLTGGAAPYTPLRSNVLFQNISILCDWSNEDPQWEDADTFTCGADYLTYDAGTCVYTYQYMCSSTVIWEGTKHGGATPAGTYARTGGTSSTAMRTLA